MTLSYIFVYKYIWFCEKEIEFSQSINKFKI